MMEAPDAGALREALRRARASGRPGLALWTERADPADGEGLGLFREAERTGEPRFYASRPERSLEIAAAGSAFALRSDAPDALAQVRAAAQALAADCARPPDVPAPLFVGGAAFEPRPSDRRDPRWRPFGGARFEVPERALLRRGDACWRIVAVRIDPDLEPADLERRASRARTTLHQALRNGPREGSAPPRDGTPSRTPAGAPHRASTPATDLGYRRAAAEVIDALRRGEASKVVLAHVSGVPLDRPFRADPVLRTLRATHPGCLSFAHGLGAQTFLGATPERLLAIDGAEVEAWAVAGTAARGASADGDRELGRALVASEKERAEHGFVVRAIVEALEKHCDEVEAPHTPSLLETGTLQHLRTVVRGRTRARLHALALAEALHPTPALGGTPREAALALIARHERFDRGWYGGPIGWFDGGGQGELWVALRCGLVAEGRAALFAGSGLVARSDPEREARETALKLSALWQALEAP